jgi:hypothetical protein
MKVHIFLKYILVILFSISSVILNGQVRFGRIIGVNLSEMTMKADGLSINPTNVAGIHFGGAIDIPLKGGLTFRPGALFSSKGTMYDLDSIDYFLSPIYIEVPVDLVFCFGWDQLKVSLFAGPYFACGIDGLKIEGSNPSRSISFGSGNTHDINLFDIGMNFGAGLNFRGLMISCQYGLGLMNVAPETDREIEMKNNVIGISLASFVARRK